jgi:hypothetical protein
MANTTVETKITGDTFSADECNNMVSAINSKQDDLTIITKNESDLIETFTGSGVWYLPFLDSLGDSLPADTIPLFIRYNGTQFLGNYDETTTPPRIYNFPNNSSATIKITTN